MDESTAKNIYERLNSLDKQFAEFIGMMKEREKTCATRHTNLDSVCTLSQELKGGWKVAMGIASIVGAVVGAFVMPIVKWLMGR